MEVPEKYEFWIDLEFSQNERLRNIVIEMICWKFRWHSIQEFSFRWLANLTMSFGNNYGSCDRTYCSTLLNCTVLTENASPGHKHFKLMKYKWLEYNSFQCLETDLWDRLKKLMSYNISVNETKLHIYKKITRILY